jgi:SnoaL-like domain
MKIGNSPRSEIEQLIAESFHRVDSGKASTGVELVTDNFTLVLPNMTIEREQYVAIMAKRERATYTTRHCFSNLRFGAETDTLVEVEFPVTVHRLNEDEADTAISVADFADRWVSSEGTWRLQSRSVTPVFPMGLGG